MTVQANVRMSVSIKDTDIGLEYSPKPTTFNPTMEIGTGPTPGLVVVAIGGTTIDLSGITNPGGLCRITNLDPTNYVEVGAWDGVEFYPIDEILPGEFYLRRLSRNLGNSYASGTGTVGSGISLRLNANQASCVCLVEAFNK